MSGIMRSWVMTRVGMIASLPMIAACGSGSPDVLFQGGQTQGGVDLGPAVYDGMVYFGLYGVGEPGLNDHAIDRVPAIGGTIESLWSGGPHGILGSGPIVTASTIFWTAGVDGGLGGDALFSLPRDGGTRALIDTFSVDAAAYAGVVSNETYVYAATFAEIVRVPRAGGAPEVVFSTPFRDALPWIGRIALDGDTLYYTLVEPVITTQNYYSIVHVCGRPAGGPAEHLADVADADGSLVVVGGVLYLPTLAGIARLTFADRTVATLGSDPGRLVVAGPDAAYAVMGADESNEDLVELDSSLTTIHSGLSYVTAAAFAGTKAVYVGAPSASSYAYLATFDLR